MRRAARIDDNQNEIVDALRKIGASVTPTSGVGKGFPDLAVGFRNRTILLELKDGQKPPSARRLTEDELKWFENWRGEAYVVESVEQAIEVITQGEKL
jgi:hypothetical protein